MIQSTDYIFGLRAVMEAIEAGRDIDRVYIKKDLDGDLARQLTDMIRANGIVSRRVPVERINKITRKNHQGVVAILSAVTYHSIDNLVPQLYEDGVTPFLMVLDGITDVRNFGAIARTCECAAVDAVVIPAHDSVSVTADAVKTSAGALSYLPVCRVNSTLSAVRYLKASGVRVVAVSEKADINYTMADYSGPVALVMGPRHIARSTPRVRHLRVDTDVWSYRITQRIGGSRSARLRSSAPAPQQQHGDHLRASERSWLL